MVSKFSLGLYKVSLFILVLAAFDLNDAKASIKVTCRDYSDGHVSLYGFLRIPSGTFNKLGTYAYLCSKQRVNCANLKANTLPYYDWVPATYSEERLEYYCSSNARIIRPKAFIDIDLQEWEDLNATARSERSVNCHQSPDGTISLSGYLEDVDGVVYLCGTRVNSCSSFQARSQFYLGNQQTREWKKAKFSIKSNRFYCKAGLKAIPGKAIKGIKVSSELWKAMISATYK